MKKSFEQKENYRTYSEFKDSDWYIYWDKEFSRIKPYQILVVWYITGDSYVTYDYNRLSELLKENTAHTGLPFVSSLDDANIKYFTKICNEFIADVDYHFKDTE